MAPGKAAAQAGHAFVDAFAKAPPEIQRAYRADGEGTKIVLMARDEVQLRQLHIHASDLEIPCALVTESGHVMPPVFDGSPIVTALGIGPLLREQARGLTKRLKLMK